MPGAHGRPPGWRRHGCRRSPRTWRTARSRRSATGTPDSWLLDANVRAHLENPHMDAPLTGVVPVVPTIFHDDQTVDLGGTARVVDYLMDAGVDGLCLLANYSESWSLTDAERDAIARTLLERVAGRLPVIVTTRHYSAR